MQWLAPEPRSVRVRGPVRFRVGAMKAFRRAVVAVAVAAVVAAFVRLRGAGGTPPSGSGWREVPADELR